MCVETVLRVVVKDGTFGDDFVDGGFSLCRELVRVAPGVR